MNGSRENINTENWVESYADLLYNYAVVRIRDHDLALDLVQDTFASGLKGLDKFKGDSSVKTWLFSILKRKIIDHWRKEEARKTRPISTFFKEDGVQRGHFLEASMPQGKFTEIEQQIDNEELREALKQCISDLPDRWQGIVVDRLVEEKESEEVCKNYDITASNLWVIIHRAKLQLRECLEKKWLNL